MNPWWIQGRTLQYTIKAMDLMMIVGNYIDLSTYFNFFEILLLTS